MSQVSIFDLLQTVDVPQARGLQRWISSMFPKVSDRTSFLLATQLEKLFEMAIYENQIDTVHLLLQQGISPNIRADWGTTPLMWASCLGYKRIAELLISYGADQHFKSFSGKVASDFNEKMDGSLPEYQTITNRRKQIHDQVKAGYLKPFGSTSTSSSDNPRNRKSKHQRQIDNGKGVDEVLKKMGQDIPQHKEKKS